MNRSHVLMTIVALSAAQVALAQVPPALRTNGNNEAEEPAVQKVSSGGVPGGGMRKFAAPAAASGFYGLLDLRHTTNDYYSSQGLRLRRDPALHAKLRLGGKFYGERLDVSAGFGGSKLPASQRVFQNRPDIMIDIYPVRGAMLNVMVYGNAMFPVRSTDLDPTEFSDGDRYDQDYRRAMDATIMTAGVAPNFKAETNLRVGRIFMRVGADAWTRMYSKPLYIRESDGSRDLGLVSEGSPAVETPFEDRAMRYVHQETVAVGYSPSFFPKLDAEIAGYSESRFLPVYRFNGQSGSWDYTYRAERVSFTRFRLAFDVTPSTSISNELYYLRNGFFAEDRINQERRFRNIVRLAFKL